jgi:glycosyltransferase involved in cell wall biosynthesis
MGFVDGTAQQPSLGGDQGGSRWRAGAGTPHRRAGGPVILGVNGIRLVAHRSGVARCIEAFLRCLDDVPHPFREIRVYSPSPIPDDVVLPTGGRNVVLRSRLPNALWEQVTLPSGHGRSGVLFCPSYIAPLFARCPVVVAHHGSYEGYRSPFPWWTLYPAWVAYAASAWRADAVSTVSAYSRRDMTRYYRVPGARIHVIPEGVDTRLFRPPDDSVAVAGYRRSLLGTEAPYIAYVGKPTERRNLSALIRAFARLKAQHGVPHRLVVMGADLPGSSPFRRVADEVGVAGDLVVRSHADHAEMVRLYQAADLVVYPSSYEGFGMPVLEAMACGTPVIALDNTAFPEFAGGVALLLPDARVDTLADGMWRVLTDTALRSRMREEGPRRAAGYDWRAITRQYLDLIVPLARVQGDA